MFNSVFFNSVFSKNQVDVQLGFGRGMWVFSQCMHVFSSGRPGAGCNQKPSRTGIEERRYLNLKHHDAETHAKESTEKLSVTLWGQCDEIPKNNKIQAHKKYTKVNEKAIVSSGLMEVIEMICLSCDSTACFPMESALAECKM